MSIALATFAQSPPATQDPREMSEAERKVYTQTLHEAKDLLDRKQYAEAITKLDKLSSERPREPQAQFMRGIALTDEGRNDDAIAAFRTLLAEFPELP